MAKKTVATFKAVKGKDFVKVIKMIKSTKNSNIVFKKN